MPVAFGVFAWGICLGYLIGCFCGFLRISADFFKYAAKPRQRYLRVKKGQTYSQMQTKCIN